MANILPLAETQFVDANGVPLAGGSVYFYVPSTLTPKDTYQNSAGSVLNTNPVVLDSAGRAIIWGSGAYRQIVKDSLGNTIWDQVTQDSSVSQALIFSTVAAMQAASSLSNGNLCTTEGYYAARDGGANSYYYSSASTATADGVNVIIPNGSPTSGRFLALWQSAEIFDRQGGVKADGITDDKVQLLAVYAAAYNNKLGVRHSPAATILTSGNITLNGSACPPYVIGRNTTIKATGSITGNLYKVENPHTAAPGFELCGLNFDANNLCSAAFYLHGSQGCRYQDLNFYNALGAVATSDGIGGKLEGEPGFGIYYNTFSGLQAGANGKSNGGSGWSLKSINNSGSFYIASNAWMGCRSQWNHGFGWDIDYCSDGGFGMEAEANDLPGFNVNHTYSLTYFGGYSEVNNQNWAKNSGSATTSVAVTALAGSIGGFTATATATAHGLQTGQVIKMSGSSDAAYNTAAGAVAQITVTDANTFTYTTVNAIANVAPTGPFTCTLSDMSFILKPFVGTTNSVSLGVQVYGGRHIGEGHNFTAELSCWFNPAQFTQNPNHFVGSDEYGNLNMERPRVRQQTIAYAATIDLSSQINGGEVIISALTGGLTISAFPPLNLVTDGTELKLTTVQDGTGSRTTTLPANVHPSGGSYPASGASKRDSVVFKADRSSAVWYEDRRSTNMAA